MHIFIIYMYTNDINDHGSEGCTLFSFSWPQSLHDVTSKGLIKAPRMSVGNNMQAMDGAILSKLYWVPSFPGHAQAGPNPNHKFQGILVLSNIRHFETHRTVRATCYWAFTKNVVVTHISASISFKIQESTYIISSKQKKKLIPPKTHAPATSLKGLEKHPAVWHVAVFFPVLLNCQKVASGSYFKCYGAHRFCWPPWLCIGTPCTH